MKAQLALRELILAGELSPGERISELSAVEQLGVSRTPVRAALARLEEEGLLETIPSGGYSVRSFGEADIFDAIEVRGVLEGAAARMAAERGVPPANEPIKDCVAALDDLVRRPDLGVEASRTTCAERALSRAAVAIGGEPGAEPTARARSALPFASPSSFVMAQSVLPERAPILTIAQEHHRAAVDAIQVAKARAPKGHARTLASGPPQFATRAARSGKPRAGARRGADPPKRGRLNSGEAESMRAEHVWTDATLHATSATRARRARLRIAPLDGARLWTPAPTSTFPSGRRPRGGSLLFARGRMEPDALSDRGQASAARAGRLGLYVVARAWRAPDHRRPNNHFELAHAPRLSPCCRRHRRHADSRHGVEPCRARRAFAGPLWRSFAADLALADEIGAAVGDRLEIFVSGEGRRIDPARKSPGSAREANFTSAGRSG